MKKVLLAAILALTPLAARAQQATDLEQGVVQDIARCLLPGLPQQWRVAIVSLELDTPGGNNGEVTYVFLRSAEAEKYEPFKPCDHKAPAAALLQARDSQPAERRNWRFARLLLYSDGKFEVKERFGEGSFTGIGLRNGYLYAATPNTVIRYKIAPGQLKPTDAPETVV